jgi:hypothetical protein
MAKDKPQIVELKHDSIQNARPEAQKILDAGKFDVPRLTIDIIENRWRAYSKHGTMLKLDPETEKFVKASLQAILLSNIIVDQRDIYYSIRMGHPDWKIGGHELKTEEAYNAFVGTIMEKLQLSTGYTMQSLGVRAGPRGYITGDDRSYFILPNGKEIKISANPVIQFNLVDNGVEFKTNSRKLIHYEKAAGMNSLLISDIPTMIEACFMTSQGYNVEAATKMHSDMEKRGLRLFVLGDADPHGMCLVGSTLITPYDGDSKAIRGFHKGEQLYTFDKEMKLAKTQIIEMSTRWANIEDIVVVTLRRPDALRNREKEVKLIVTKNHPFFSLDVDHWVEAGGLRKGNIVAEGITQTTRDKMARQTYNMDGTKKFRKEHPLFLSEIAVKGLQSLHPSKTELLIIGLAKYFDLPIEYLKNSLNIEGFVPDFKVIGKNKLIEVCNSKYIQYRRNQTYEDYKYERTTAYTKHGYKVLFIDVETAGLDEIVGEIRKFIANGAVVVNVQQANWSHISHLVERGEVKQKNNEVFIKVFNFHCEPYNWFFADGILVHNSIQLMYGRASKSNAYMPESFYPKTARLLGLFPRIALELGLPPEHVTDVHMRVVPNLRKIISETNPDMMPDVEVIERQRKQWEWQSLNGLGTEAPALYLIESLYAKGDEIKYVPEAKTMKDAMIQTVQEELETFVNDKITSFARRWLNENLFPKLVEQLKEEFFKDEIDAFNAQAADEIEKLKNLSPEDFREAIKLKLVKNPKQFYGDAARKVIDEIVSKTFNIDAKIDAEINVTDAKVDNEVQISKPEVPDIPLEKHDIIEAIEKRISGKNMLIQKLRKAIQKVIGIPSEQW